MPYPDSSKLPPDPDRSELLRLRFASVGAEQQFRRDHEATARSSRLVLLGLGTLMIASTPLYDRSLLHAPGAYIEFSRWIQFGILLPVMLMMLFLTWHTRLRRLSPLGVVLGLPLISGSLCAQHVVGLSLGFGVPDNFGALAVAGTFMLGQLRLFYFLPWAALIMIGLSLVQLHAAAYEAAAIYNTISAWMLFALAVASAYLLEVSARRNWRQSRALETEAAHDPLTGLPNRRYFDAMMLRLVRQAAREQKSVALLMLDVDHFKAFNDRYGHPAGDECLRLVSRSMSDSMRRPQDFCARIGGEEFAAVWFDAQVSAAPALAENLRAGIRLLAIPHAASSTGPIVSASAGFVQVFSPNSENAAEEIAAELIALADQALYQAKREGRDRMIEAQFPPA